MHGVLNGFITYNTQKNYKDLTPNESVIIMVIIL